MVPRRQSSQKSINKKPSKVLSRRKSADRLVTKTKQPPMRHGQKKRIRKSASNLHSQNTVFKTKLPPKKHARDSAARKSQKESNLKKKAIPKRIKSNRQVNYMSHRKSHKDLHAKPPPKPSYQSHLPEPNTKMGTQSSINNSSRPLRPPPKLPSHKPSSKYTSQNQPKPKGIPPMPYNSSKPESNINMLRGKYNSRKSGRMLHYQDYIRKMQENKMQRKQSQKRLSSRGQVAGEEQRVYRSRVSSAEIRRDSADRYNKMYGYKPLWYG